MCKELVKMFHTEANVSYVSSFKLEDVYNYHLFFLAQSNKGDEII